MQTFLQGNPTINAIVASFLTVTVLTVSYFFFEPMMALGAGATDSFTVTQEVTSEIAFSTTANDVTMTPTLQGLTGGNAFGTSTVLVNTNNPTGYNMTIKFATTTALQGVGVSSDIPNYPAGSGTPDYAWALGANTAGFGYTVVGDVTTTFKNDGASCNTGVSNTSGKCWYMQSDASTTQAIINRATATPGTGATTTIVFQVGITANPSPAIQTGFYNATATLTAVVN